MPTMYYKPTQLSPQSSCMGIDVYVVYAHKKSLMLTHYKIRFSSWVPVFGDFTKANYNLLFALELVEASILAAGLHQSPHCRPRRFHWSRCLTYVCIGRTFMVMYSRSLLSRLHLPAYYISHAAKEHRNKERGRGAIRPCKTSHDWQAYLELSLCYYILLKLGTRFHVTRGVSLTIVHVVRSCMHILQCRLELA